jgi:hypothetical protein
MPSLPPRALATLLDSIVDYAGLFPPAKLAMQTAVENYARDRAGSHAAMLGRFICPASRLAEFSKVASPLLPGTFATSGYREHARTTDDHGPWLVSVLMDGVTPADPEGGFRKDLETIAAFNLRHAHEDHGLTIADTIEVRPPTPDFVDGVIDDIPEEIFPFFEIPPEGDARGFIAALPGHAAGAKIRTGGVTPDAFPTPQRVALFIEACLLADLPFKATAGLHHPLKGEYPLTYEKGCPKGTMLGFLNVFIAAAMAYTHRDKINSDMLAEILAEKDPKAFFITDEGISWKRLVLDVTQIARAREAFAVSFGSCSFDEPVTDLRSIGLL